ncbi:MAG: RagB/SusD family nutrient uptake outer membrane protein [Bacteroidales bacterium]|nr:RagB/SusD family nutrient uptake outer membrane protein [Bacteroidales bacterium]
MKKITYILSAAVAFMTLFSCSAMLDSEEQLGALDTDKYYAEASDPQAEALAASMYTSAWSQFGNADMDNYTDDWVSTDPYKPTNNDGFMTSLYSGLYQLVYKANLIIEKLPDNTAVKKRVIGEAYFMRGWAYFNLIRAYQTPPYVDHVLTSDELAAISNGTTSELWDLCTSSFQKASELLPAKGSKGNQRNIGAHVTKEAALAFMGKAYLYAGNKSAAAAALKQVIDGGAYALLPDFRDLYTVKADFCDEYIWEFNAADDDVSQRSNEAKIDFYSNWRGEVLIMPGGCHLTGFVQGYAQTMPSKDLYDWMLAREGHSARLEGSVWTVEEAAQKFVDLSAPAYAGTPNYEGDQLAAMKAAHPGITDYQAGMRLLWTADMSQPTSSTMQGVLPAKIYMWCSDMYPATSTHDIYSMANYPAMRYADVLLLYAEAANDVNALNQVRQRAGLPALGAYSDAELRAERRAEFFDENERFWDCVRWGIAATEFAKVGSITYNTEVSPATYEVKITSTPVDNWLGWDDKYKAFPYATSELRQTSINQNPGW